MPKTLTYPLHHGRLTLHIDHADPPFETLCSLASRQNPKRPWLFVSRVLGRHLPVAPHVMRAIHRQMAHTIPPDLPGPVWMVGMAETAIALGQGIHEAYLETTHRTDVLYAHTTRYHLDHPTAFSFEEQHSHATHHRIYEPRDPEEQQLLNTCQSLVLIDDEASTGATFRNLIQASRARIPHLKHIFCLVMTDWMGEANREKLRYGTPLPVTISALLSGSHTFEADPHMPPAVLPDVMGNGQLKDALLPINHGRFGLRFPPTLPPHIVASLTIRPGEKICVLGTGEFVFLPYLLARFIESCGAEATVQATTRSPILPGGDMHHRIQFQDAYDDNIPNFIYSVDLRRYTRIFVCYETPPETRQVTLLKQLNAEPLYFSHPQPQDPPR